MAIRKKLLVQEPREVVIYVLVNNSHSVKRNYCVQAVNEGPLAEMKYSHVCLHPRKGRQWTFGTAEDNGFIFWEQLDISS